MNVNVSEGESSGVIDLQAVIFLRKDVWIGFYCHYLVVFLSYFDVLDQTVSSVFFTLHEKTQIK